MSVLLRAGAITCPFCKDTAQVRRGRIVPHSYVIRGWARDDNNENVTADITVTCAPTIRVVVP